MDAPKKLVVSPEQMSFGDWLTRHGKCNLSRFESGDHEYGIVAFCCESGCEEIYLQDSISPPDAEWLALFSFGKTRDA